MRPTATHRRRATHRHAGLHAARSPPADVSSDGLHQPCRSLSLDSSRFRNRMKMWNIHTTTTRSRPVVGPRHRRRRWRRRSGAGSGPVSAYSSRTDASNGSTNAFAPNRPMFQPTTPDFRSDHRPPRTRLDAPDRTAAAAILVRFASSGVPTASARPADVTAPVDPSSDPVGMCPIGPLGEVVR